MTSNNSSRYAIQILSGALLSGDVKNTLYVNHGPERLEADPDQIIWLDDRAHAVSAMLRLADRLLMESFNPEQITTIKLLEDIIGRDKPYDPAYITLNLLELGWRDPRFSVQSSTVVLSTIVSVAYNERVKLRCFRERYEAHQTVSRFPLRRFPALPHVDDLDDL